MKDKDNIISGMEDDAAIMAKLILYRGVEVGFRTNPNMKNSEPFIEVNGEKVVCIAQGGECRYNHRYYSPGLSDAKSWTTPIIDKSCPDQCCYKVLVCDNHGGKCESSIEYYPQYNKFAWLYKKYCRELDKLKDDKTDKK